MAENNPRNETESILSNSDPIEVARRHAELGDRRGQFPEQIGPYKVLSELGAGGMGIVYLAEQTKPIHRRVALKIIKLGMDTKQVVARFETEREALALMNHPNVAKVFDAGTTEQGRPYFAMEYIAGIPITDYCDKHRLNTEERLRLFMDVCHAVQHAHQKGIIHRDIKPSNVLVTVQDEKPVPKVIDFGVSKATQHRLTENTIFTEQGQLIGTPGYMSPEQAEMTALDIDTRTDIYSLGVLLYELLVGALPFENKTLFAGGLAEIQRIIREVDPPKPSTRLSAMSEPRTSVRATPSPPGRGQGEGLVEIPKTSGSLATIAHSRRTEPRTLIRQIRGDLDWIVMRCLEKDRTRRYDTANTVALEIQHYLKHEPVLAGPPTAAYRMRKFIRRNKPVFIATTIIFTTALVGAAGSFWQALRAGRAEHLAQARLVEAREAANRFQAVNLFLHTMLASADPIQTGRRDVSVREVVDSAARKLDENTFRDPAIETSIRSTIGETYRGLGMYDESEAQARKAIELCTRLPANDSGCACANLLGGRILMGRGEYAASKPLLQKAVEAFRKLTGEERWLTEALHELAYTEAQLGRSTQAEALFNESIEMGKRVYSEDNDELAQQYHAIAALIYEPRSRLQDAEAMCRKALAIKRKLHPNGHPNTGECLSDLARIIGKQGRHEEAEMLAREGLAMNWRLVGPSHPFTAESTLDLASILGRMKRYEEAEDYYTDALQMMTAIAGDGSARTKTMRIELGQLLRENGQFAQAEVVLSKSLDLPKASEETRRLSRDLNLALLGELLVMQGDYGKAEPLLRECLTIREIESPDAWTYFNAKSLLGAALSGQGNFQEAETLLLEGYENMLERVGAIPLVAREARLREALERIIRLYESWDAAEPGKGYNTKAAEWRARHEEPSSK